MDARRWRGVGVGGEGLQKLAGAGPLLNFTGLGGTHPGLSGLLVSGGQSPRYATHSGVLVPTREPAAGRDVSYLAESGARSPRADPWLARHASQSPRGSPSPNPRVLVASAPPRRAAAAVPSSIASRDSYMPAALPVEDLTAVSTRALPANRADVLLLSSRLESALAVAAGDGAAQKQLWRTAHGELLAQVQVHCFERGELLGRCHVVLAGEHEQLEAQVRLLRSVHAEASEVARLQLALNEAETAHAETRAQLRRAGEGWGSARALSQGEVTVNSALDAVKALTLGYAPPAELANPGAQHPRQHPTALGFRRTATPGEAQGIRGGWGRPCAQGPEARADSPTSTGRGSSRPVRAVHRGPTSTADTGMTRSGRTTLRSKLTDALSILGAEDRLALMLELTLSGPPLPRSRPTDHVEGDAASAHGSPPAVAARGPSSLGRTSVRGVPRAAPNGGGTEGGEDLPAAGRAVSDDAAETGTRVAALLALFESGFDEGERAAFVAQALLRAPPTERRAMLEGTLRLVAVRRPLEEWSELFEPLFWTAGEGRWHKIVQGLYDAMPARSKLQMLRAMLPVLRADEREVLGIDESTGAWSEGSETKETEEAAETAEAAETVEAGAQTDPLLLGEGSVAARPANAHAVPQSFGVSASADGTPLRQILARSLSQAAAHSLSPTGWRHSPPARVSAGAHVTIGPVERESAHAILHRSRSPGAGAGTWRPLRVPTTGSSGQACAPVGHNSVMQPLGSAG
ncbi:hypothetical protein T492DRAFT_914271 [Pavlovales sp. CCMP2436]|nr:hypothetical protein T492DRAFT_914271 [Pavlovales sp. CCMP2436]